MSEVTGKLEGLAPSELKALARIYRRSVAPSEVISSELATFVCGLSRSLERQIGLLINRRGAIEHVVVGDASKLMLPDFGRLRAGRGRFRGLRLVHTHLRNEALTRDDLVDLALLRLDLVAALGVSHSGNPLDLHVAHLMPPRDGETPWLLLPPIAFHRAELEVDELISSLEAEFEKVVPRNRAAGGAERALAVVVELRSNRGQRGGVVLRTSLEGRVAELKELCRTAGIEIGAVMEQRRPDPDPKYLVGRGKLEEILIRAMQLDAGVLIFDPELTPGQAHSIADFTDLKVLDRTMVILDIFAQRAKSRDGKLQVELAQLKYRLPRLNEKNTMMSRLTGGIGGRGPGETKLEENRRSARERIHRLEQEILRYGRHRTERRRRRTQSGIPIVAIVGYTNAGKSTLLNTLTRSEVLAENKLFATLDPTTRRLRLPFNYVAPEATDEDAPYHPDSARTDVILADTVGFIRELPQDLLAAFRATLEELNDADLLLHLVDASDPDHEMQIAAVEKILGELELAETPRVIVANKIDRLSPEDLERWRHRPDAVAISGRELSSLKPLIHVLESRLGISVAPGTGTGPA